MFLLVNECNEALQVVEMTDDIVKAINDGVMSVYRWNAEAGTFEEGDASVNVSRTLWNEVEIAC